MVYNLILLDCSGCFEYEVLGFVFLGSENEVFYWNVCDVFNCRSSDWVIFMGLGIN